MKILQINSVCGVGSTGKIARDLYHDLRAAGHSCKIAWGRRRGGDVPVEDTIRIGNKLDNYRHWLTTRLLDHHGFAAPGATRRFLREVEAYNPDLIHLHNIHGYYIHLGELFRFLAEYGKPVVWTLHCCWPFTGHCSHFDFIGCDKWKTECHDCPQTGSYPVSFCPDNSRRNYREKKALFTSVPDMTLVSPSHWLAGLVKQSFLGKYPVEVIHNGIDTNMFKPTPSNLRQQFGLKNKKIVLGVANVWTERKGYGDMLELAAMLPAEYQVVMIGLNKKQLQTLPKKIFGIMRTDSMKELVQWYSAADVFVNPTYEEVLGLVNLEAQACGTPVITYNSGGSPECVDNIHGIVTDKKRPEELKKMIIGSLPAKFDKDFEMKYEFMKLGMAQKYLDLYNRSDYENSKIKN